MENMENIENMEEIIELLVESLVKLQKSFKKVGEITNNEQMMFLSGSLKLILKSAENPDFALLFIKHANNYLMDRALKIKKITSNEYWRSKVESPENYN